MIDFIAPEIAIPLALLAWIAYFIVEAVQNSREEKYMAAIEARYDAEGNYIGIPETGGVES